MLQGNRACRTCNEDATRKLLPWNSGLTRIIRRIYYTTRRRQSIAEWYRRCDVVPGVGPCMDCGANAWQRTITEQTARIRPTKAAVENLIRSPTNEHIPTTEAFLLPDPERGMFYLKNSDRTQASDSLGANWNRICLSRLLNHGALWQTVLLHLINILAYLLTFLHETINFFACNFSKSSLILFFFTTKLSHKYLVKWWLNSPPHLKCAFVLPCGYH